MVISCVVACPWTGGGAACVANCVNPVDGLPRHRREDGEINQRLIWKQLQRS